MILPTIHINLGETSSMQGGRGHIHGQVLQKLAHWKFHHLSVVVQPTFSEVNNLSNKLHVQCTSEQQKAVTPDMIDALHLKYIFILTKIGKCSPPCLDCNMNFSSQTEIQRGWHTAV